MEFSIALADSKQISDAEITELLQRVYVDAGYTSADTALTLFAPQSVRARGELYFARDDATNELAAMVILVPPTSPAKKLAKDNECEMHLLGVKEKYRGHGLGRKLVDTVVSRAQESGYEKMILWTQVPMKAAQELYKASGFVYQKDFQANGYDFLLYGKVL